MSTPTAKSTDILLIIPTAAGVRASVNGLEVYKPMTARQLAWMACRFAEAAAERLGQDGPGKWGPIAVENCR